MASYSRSHSSSRSAHYEEDPGPSRSKSPSTALSDFKPDMSHEYTCFLCNGYQTVIGTIVIDSVGIELINAIGMKLETNTYDQIVSVNEIEPYSYHTLVLVFPSRYVVLSHLLRKSKLVDVFKTVGLYKDEPRLPLEAIGFYDPEVINENHHDDTLRLSLNEDMMREDRVYEEDEEEAEYLQERRRGGTNPSLSSTRYNEDDQWSNKEEQERHMQREIVTQSMLNPIQMLSSEDHARKRTVSSGEWMQLEKYHSSPSQALNTGRGSTSSQRAVVTIQAKFHPSAVHVSDEASGSSNRTRIKRQVVRLDELIDQLKTMFPDHSDTTLEASLRDCNYDINEAITMLLGEDQGD